MTTLARRMRLRLALGARPLHWEPGIWKRFRSSIAHGAQSLVIPISKIAGGDREPEGRSLLSWGRGGTVGADSGEFFQFAAGRSA